MMLDTVQNKELVVEVLGRPTVSYIQARAFTLRLVIG